MSEERILKEIRAALEKDVRIYRRCTNDVEQDIECLLVMDSNHLAGLVSPTDLLRELAKT